MLSVEDVDLTPNPHALKFILNEKLLNFERRHFGNKTEAANDPLALGVFRNSRSSIGFLYRQIYHD